jgi:Family of unknown function (DUF6247)
MPFSVRLGAVADVIRSVQLAELAPHDLAEFEAEFRCAVAQAGDDFDLASAVINRWWGRASADPSTHSGGRRVSVDVTDEQLVLIEGQVREAHTGMDHRGGVTLLDLAAAVEAHRAQRREAVR